MRRTLLVLAILGAAASAAADTFHVDASGAGDYTEIQPAIDAAQEGDTVLVAPGTYTGENNRGLDTQGVNLVILSSGGPEATVIDAESQSLIFAYLGGQTSDSKLSGFTLRNGNHGWGAAIYCYGASPVIENCRIENCHATGTGYGGGGLCAYQYASPSLVDVVFSGNTGDYGGAVLASLNSLPSLTRVRFEGNEAWSRGGAVCLDGTGGGVTDIVDCTFYDNQCLGAGGGGGLYVWISTFNLSGCTFAWNTAYLGQHISNGSTAVLDIQDSIFAFGRSIGGVINDPGELCTIARCVCWWNEYSNDLPGDTSDIINEDPRFCGLENGNLLHCANSVCLPGNNGFGVLIGAEGEGCPDCGTPVQPSSWSRVKALY